MNKNIRALKVILTLCFIVLFVQLIQLHLVQRQELQENPNNTRVVVREFNQERGLITTSDGVIIAESQEVESELKYQRRYPHGTLYAQVTGYFSFLYGSEGLERSHNEYLSGNITDKPVIITSTLNHAIQQKAQEALGTRNGSIVVLNPQTGEILALWSYPSYDPNPISSANLDEVQSSWEKLSEKSSLNDPRLARTYRQIYFPGSTFKLVTAAAALTSGKVTLTEPEFENREEYLPPLTDLPLRNYGVGTCGGNIFEGLRVSCNSTFAELSAEIIGAELMIKTSESFGFNQEPPFDLPLTTASIFPSDFGNPIGQLTSFSIPILENTPGLAQAGIGQYDVKASPLQMALVAAAIANDGIIMKPYVTQSVHSATGEMIEQIMPSVWKSALPSQIARSLKVAMKDIVENGTARRMMVSESAIGGKTGTAQVDSKRPDDTHGWVIGFGGPESGPSSVAIAVLVESIPGEGQNTGGSDAAPIAKIILEQVLLIQGHIN